MWMSMTYCPCPCRKGWRGCFDAIVIDRAVGQEMKELKRNLAVAWIDYKKAFDLIPHRWLKWMLELLNLPGEEPGDLETDITLCTSRGPVRIQSKAPTRQNMSAKIKSVLRPTRQ